MNKANLILLLFVQLLIGVSVGAQSKKSFDGYFDNDRVKDKISIEQSEGSAASFFHITCAFSTLPKPLIIDCEYSFSEFLFRCPIPDVVTDRKQFADQLAHQLIPEVSDHIDHNAMKWLADVCANGSFANDRFTDYKSRFSLHWIKGLPDLYKPSYTIIPKSSFRCLHDNIDKPRYKSSYSLVGYMANNHKGIIREYDAPDYKVLFTNHGVFLQKIDTYAWVFINEESIFKTGHEKLRWQSIADVRVYDNYLVINTKALPAETKNTYVICLSTWQMFRLSDKGARVSLKECHLCD